MSTVVELEVSTQVFLQVAAAPGEYPVSIIHHSWSLEERRNRADLLELLTRKLCCRKETARCRSCSFWFKVRRLHSLHDYKFKSSHASFEARLQSSVDSGTNLAPTSEDPKLIIRVINFELVQPICSAYVNVTDGRTDDLR